MTSAQRLNRIREFLADEPLAAARCDHFREAQNFMADDYREPLCSILIIDTQYEAIQAVMKMDKMEWDEFRKRSPRRAKKLAKYRKYST